MKICPGPGGSSRRWAGCPLEVGERLYFEPVDTHSFINIENSPLSPFSTFVFYFVFLWYVEHEAEKFFPDWFKSDALSLHPITLLPSTLFSLFQRRLPSPAVPAPAQWGNPWVWVEGEPWEPWFLTPPHPTRSFYLSTEGRLSLYWSRSHAMVGCMGALTAACGG